MSIQMLQFGEGVLCLQSLLLLHCIAYNGRIIMYFTSEIELLQNDL
jgi:hypothetical protein